MMTVIEFLPFLASRTHMRARTYLELICPVDRSRALVTEPDLVRLFANIPFIFSRNVIGEGGT